MNILFALGDRASAEDIRAELSDAPSYSAVRAMLAKLEAKATCVIAKRPSLCLLPHNTPANRQTCRRAATVARVLRRLRRRSRLRALKDENWTDDELESLSAEIERVRNERRQS